MSGQIHRNFHTKYYFKCSSIKIKTMVGIFPKYQVYNDFSLRSTENQIFDNNFLSKSFNILICFNESNLMRSTQLRQQNSIRIFQIRQLYSRQYIFFCSFLSNFLIQIVHSSIYLNFIHVFQEEYDKTGLQCLDHFEFILVSFYNHFMTEIAPNIDINQAIQAFKFPQDNIQTSPELDAKQIEPQSQRKFTTTELPKQETPSQKKQTLGQPKFSKSTKIAIGIAIFIFVGMVISFILFFLVTLRPEIKSSSNTQEGKLDDGSTLAVNELIMEIKSLAGPNQKYQVIHTQAVSLQKNKSRSAYLDTINLKDQGILVNISPNQTIKVGILLEKFTEYVTKNAKNKNLKKEIQQDNNKTLEQKLTSKINESIKQKYILDEKLIDLMDDQNSFCFDRESKQYRQCNQLNSTKPRNLFSLQILPSDVGQEILSSLADRIFLIITTVDKYFSAQNSQSIGQGSTHQFQKHCFAQTSQKFICHH